MAKLSWDDPGEHLYETGVDHGVLYIPNSQGVYDKGYPWNGLTAVTESPSGAEANAQYADNMKYLNLISAEEFGATVEAFTYPDEFAQCDGSAVPIPGFTIGQQPRKSFGLSYRTKIGNDIDGQDHGYKLHLVYNALAKPSERAYSTVNDSPEAIGLSWELTTTPVNIPGFKPSAIITLDSTKIPANKMAEVEDVLYGTAGQDPKLPSPQELIDMLSNTLVEVKPTAPTYDAGTHTITIPTITGVVYQIDGKNVTGAKVITKDTIVTAVPATGYKFPAVTDTDWLFEF